MSENIIAIVQARMGSTRLPGKVMQKIINKPMIEILLSRLSQSKLITQIILATSLNEENDELCEFVKSLHYSVFRGNEDDVLDRFVKASEKTNADHIVRITGDSPLIDPFICDQLIEYYLQEKADYAYLSSHFCEGLDCEVISKRALDIANKNANKMSEREHVTLYLYDHPELFLNVKLTNNTDDSHYRFTVDNQEDFTVVSNIIENNIANLQSLTSFQTKQYLDNHPEIKKLNSHIIRNEGLLKSIDNDYLIKQ
ncbi:MAG: glycosyltransferase family protein [Alteromonadaceae bacterium]|nr:glycosyltransferase family protein [Alteromonadaceae bacterium]